LEAPKPKESLADVTQKRRGLVIVKKKKDYEAPAPVKDEKKVEAAVTNISDFKSMFSASDENLARKKKKEKKERIMNCISFDELLNERCGCEEMPE